MTIDELFNLQPYSLNKENKASLLNQWFKNLTEFHYNNCENYKKMLDSTGYSLSSEFNYFDMPFLPVQLFKLHDLLSVKKELIVKTMTSSGTSGQAVSKIYLDKINALNQTKTLTKIVSTYIGAQRAPMIIIDSPGILKNREMFSARGAGILGFSIFGTKKIYALDDNMNLNTDILIEFIEKNKDKKIFIFGFTYMIFQFFIKELKKKKINLDLSNSVLIHGGGWKKLINESISPQEFRAQLNQYCNISSVHDYYGMVEQTGSIYMECEYGHLHASIYSDIIIRNTEDFSHAPIGKPGIIQTLSILPTSYPGHSLLTEDEGVLLGEDNCKCGRLGKYFKINGRLKNAEIRGCSNTYEDS